MSRLQLELPWPPSINHYWRQVKIGGAVRTIISAEGRAYRERVVPRVQLAMMQARVRTLPGRLALAILAQPPDRRRRDLDNILKPLLDALQQARCYQDDCQIDDLHVRRLPPDRPAGSITVTIEEMEW